MVALAHTSLMTRLIRTQKKHKNNLHYEKKTDAFAFFSRLIFKRDSIRLIMTVTRSFYNFRKLFSSVLWCLNVVPQTVQEVPDFLSS